jgi:N utilization substance protein B
MDRMPPIDRNILRIAIFEILWAAEIDIQVACDEAVELAKAFSTDESSSYINGVLGRIIKLKDSIAL